MKENTALDNRQGVYLPMDHLSHRMPLVFVDKSKQNENNCIVLYTQVPVGQFWRWKYLKYAYLFFIRLSSFRNDKRSCWLSWKTCSSVLADEWSESVAAERTDKRAEETSDTVKKSQSLYRLSRAVTDQTLSSRKHVLFIKPEVFPDFPLLQPGILPRSLITPLCTCSQPGVFPDFPLPRTGIRADLFIFNQRP